VFCVPDVLEPLAYSSSLSFPELREEELDLEPDPLLPVFLDPEEVELALLVVFFVDLELFAMVINFFFGVQIEIH
jgi:hypothetical protein